MERTGSMLLLFAAASLSMLIEVEGIQAVPQTACFLTLHTKRDSNEEKSSPQRQTASSEGGTESIRCPDIQPSDMENSTTPQEEELAILEVDLFDRIEIQTVMNVSENASCLWEHDNITRHCTVDKDRKTYSFLISQAKECHAGMHQLSFQSSSVSYSMRFAVRVRTPPTAPVLRVLHREMLGFPCKVQCSSESYPEPKIEWILCQESRESCLKLDGKIISPLETADTYGVRKKVSWVWGSDLFQYNDIRCCAENSAGKECSQLHSFELPSRTNPEVADTNVILKVEEAFLLRFSVPDTDGPVELSWTPANATKQTMVPFEKERAHINNVLFHIVYMFLDAVKKEDTGTYSCTSKTRTKSVQLSVVEQGFISLMHADTVRHIVEGETVCFTMELFAYPPVRCRWSSPQEPHPCVAKGSSSYRRTYKFCDHHQTPGKYDFYADNKDSHMNRSMRLYKKEKPRLSLMPEFEGKVQCIGEGYPAPEMTWWKCGFSDNCSAEASWKKLTEKPKVQVSEGGRFGHKVELQTLNVTQVNGEFHIRCCANNTEGWDCEQNPLKLAVSAPKPHVSDQSLYYAALGFCVPAFVCIVCLTYYNHKKKPKYESQLKMVQLLGPSDNDYIYIDFSHVEYDQKWEFPRENLEIGKELGSGAFGKVVEATAYGISKPGVSEQVAVKMLKAFCRSKSALFSMCCLLLSELHNMDTFQMEKFQPSEKEALMSELKMMTHIGTHENIVNLLGACTVTGPVYLIFQYCPYGDLLNYLRINREQFHKTLTDVFTQNHFSLYHNFQPDHTFRDGSFTPSGSYVPMHRIRDTASTEESDILLSASDPAHCACHEECDSNYQNTRKNLDEELHVLTFEDLLSFSYQVAKGMEFLTERNCIHRDLAARNVLVTHEKVVKIGDFGLARDIMNDSNYIVKGNARLPVKWMSPESLFEGLYTVQSDVWSYGILLWEIFSLGVNPYPGIQVDQSFYKLIQNGFKMEQPYYSTESVYQVMQSCWTLDARKRPGFSQIVSFMESQLSDAEAALYQTPPRKDRLRSSSDYKNAPANCSTEEEAL
ncbi:receptor-type tyrosine-protein kinase FLT3-like isoform X2 [Acipenser ruthenus]|uniref:receptor-type tyrosine-protein kinase FLT3-like isoform X2 n=1 Tax=Acipenser ruthenus TaxID=7906 RepID=UPI002741AFE4|nr:receptor-type tyrosine-protein kinase FLT3-like isoform X2 [Acipenser ruthenus]